MRTCNSGAVALLDLHAAVAPRNDRIQQLPILDSSHYFPYDERSLASNHLGTSLLDYAEMCSSFVLERMHYLLSSAVEDGLRNLKQMRRLVDEARWTPAANEKLSEFLRSPDSVALKTLEKIFAVPHDDAFSQKVNSIVSESWAEVVSSDCLMGFARGYRCFKTGFDVVLDNVPIESGLHHINIVECEAGTGQAYLPLMHMLSLYRRISVSYTAADPAPMQSIDAELAKKLGIETVEWSLEATKPIPGLASAADLVILANVLHRRDNISRALSSASSLVRDNGFLLIVEATSNFAIPWSFFALTHDVTHMSDISSRTCGPYCDESTWATMLTNAGLTLVAQKSDGFLHTVFLCRKLSSTSLEQVPRIIDVDYESFDWLEEVKSVMMQERNEPGANCSVWLRAKKADSGLVGMMNCLRREPNGDRLR